MKTWEDAIAQYDEFLNEMHDYSLVLGLAFSPAEILQQCDPVAYKAELFNYIDSEGVDSDDLVGELRL